MKHIADYDDVLAKYPETAWERAAARDALDHIAKNTAGPFPCVFAAQAVAKGGLRYCFSPDHEGSNIAAGLTEFLRAARAIGPYATLTYVFPPDEGQPGLDAYRQRFWAALRRLHQADPSPWPEDIPQSPHDPNWTFCFDGEAIFPLCLTPAHQKKRTRYARHLTISFQPRWVFRHHLPDRARMERYSRLIQEKMRGFDASPVSPFLGLYGSGFLDAEKYFFHDDNLAVPFPSSLA